MEIKLLGEKQTILAKLDSELDHHTANRIREMIDSKIRSTNAVNVIFDFSNLSFMDSSGIGVIMGRYKLLKSLDGKVFITGANVIVKRIISMSGIDKIVNVCQSVEKALELL